MLSEPRPAARGGAAQGRGAAVAPAGPVAPGAVPNSPAVAPVPFGGVDPVYAVGTDGLLHTILSSNGTDAEPPVPFLPPSTRPASLVFVDGIVYTSTSNGCGAAPNAVWAIDLASKEKKVTTWTTGGASVAGSGGPAFGTTGTLYVSVAANGFRRCGCVRIRLPDHQRGGRARPQDARAKRLVHRRRRRLQRLANRHPLQGS